MLTKAGGLQMCPDGEQAHGAELAPQSRAGRSQAVCAHGGLQPQRRWAVLGVLAGGWVPAERAATEDPWE